MITLQKQIDNFMIMRPTKVAVLKMQIYFNWLTKVKTFSILLEEETYLWSNGLVVKALGSHSRDPVFKTTGWLQSRLNLTSIRV